MREIRNRKPGPSVKFPQIKEKALVGNSNMPSKAIKL